MSDDFGWGYFVLGLIMFQILKMLYMATAEYLRQRRAKRFIRLVHVTFPEATNIAFVSLDSSDRRAFKELENELMDLYDLKEEQLRREA